MDKTTINKAINAMRKISKETKSISFYGGEPLIKENYDIISYAIDKLKDNGFEYFDAITNGYDLEVYEKYLGNIFKYFQITLDGPPEIHNKRRFLENGEPTFYKIIDNIKLALIKNVRISLRINIDKSNLKDLDKLIKIFEEENFLKKSNFSYYISPVDTINEKWCYTSYELKTVIENKLFDKNIYINSPHNEIIQNIYLSLKNKSPYNFKIISCGAN